MYRTNNAVLAITQDKLLCQIHYDILLDKLLCSSHINNDIILDKLLCTSQIKVA